MQTVELQLAVDNRGTREQPTEIDTIPAAAAEFAVAMPEEFPEVAADERAAPEGAPPAAPAAAPAVGTDATPANLPDQRKLRVRRNTSLLIGGLVLILLAVTTAISIVLQYTAERGGEQSVLIPPEDRPAAPTPPVAGDAAKPAAVRPLRKEVTGTQAAITQSANVPGDPDWYGSPAIEPQDSGTQITVSRGTTENPLFPKLSEAWNAFQASDYTRAETLYREVQAADAGNVDAMLGLAAIALRTGRPREAESLYDAVLEADPQNSTAIAALSMLPAGSTATGDTRNETRLKNLLQEQPGSAELHFALGLQHVGDGRWPEAQQAFFEAVRNDPVNADYAYNLAVSLDQLGQSAAAAAYYERALALAVESTLFDATAARQRLAGLRAATR
jgi:Flp pilus assembly protein TadD